jgi:glycosyltransferase involved in cell wall biosynthesis
MTAAHKLKIALVSQYFFPDYAATGNLMTGLASGLAKKGCDIQVYTGYPSYWGIKQKCKKQEIFDGVTINRIFHLRLDTRTKIGSIFHGLSFFIFTLFRLLFLVDKRLLLIVTTPPFLPFIGYILKKVRNRDYIVIIHDIDPDISIKVHFIKKGLITCLWERGNRLVYKNAEKIIVLSECMADIIRSKCKDVHGKLVIIQNWEDGHFIKPMKKDENWFAINNNLLDKFVVLYSGNMGLNHDLVPFVESAQYLKKTTVEFLFIGEGAQKDKLIKKSQDLHLMNIRFLDYQPREILPYTTTCGDVILISQERGTEGLCVSSKFYTALAAGKPIIALTGENSEISKVLKEKNCGFNLSSYNPHEIAECILKLESDKEFCNQLGENSRKVFEDEFTYQKAVNKYYNIISNQIVPE